MLTGQVIVFLLILQTALAIEADVAETANELESASTRGMMDITSENVMLDCCLSLHTWVGESSEPTAEEILSRAGIWEERVMEYLCSMGMNCTIDLTDVVVEPLTNQTADPLQMGFLGETGNEQWHMSALLNVCLLIGTFGMETIYPISIIA
jgi:hypothetical protein